MGITYGTKDPSNFAEKKLIVTLVALNDDEAWNMLQREND